MMVTLMKMRNRAFLVVNFKGVFNFLLFLSCMLFVLGCSPATKYETFREYKETTEWSHEEGIVKSWQTTCGVDWDID